MYSKKSWGGPVDPFVLVNFIETDKNKDIKDPTVSVVVWEWKDTALLGKYTGEQVRRTAAYRMHVSDSSTGRKHLQ